MIDLSDTRPQPPEDDYTPPALFDIKELKRQLSERASTWVPEHFPHGRISADRSEWRTANTHGDAPHRPCRCRVRRWARRCHASEAEGEWQGQRPRQPPPER